MKTMRGLECLSYEERLREVFSLENRRLCRRLTSVYKYLTGVCKEDRARLFSVVPSAKTRGKEHKPKHRRVSSEHQETLFHCEGD